VCDRHSNVVDVFVVVGFWVEERRGGRKIVEEI